MTLTDFPFVTIGYELVDGRLTYFKRKQKRFSILGLDMHTEWPGLVAWTLGRGPIPEHADTFRRLLAMKLSWDLDRNPPFPEPDAEARRIAFELTEPVIALVA